jgi:hypothetical protein
LAVLFETFPEAERDTADDHNHHEEDDEKKPGVVRLACADLALGD